MKFLTGQNHKAILRRNCRKEQYITEDGECIVKEEKKRWSIMGMEYLQAAG